MTTESMFTANDVTALSWVSNVCRKKCFVPFPCSCRCQTLTVPSTESVNTRPSNPAATVLMASSWARMDSKHFESEILHTFRVLSQAQARNGVEMLYSENCPFAPDFHVVFRFHGAFKEILESV